MKRIRKRARETARQTDREQREIGRAREREASALVSRRLLKQRDKKGKDLTPSQRIFSVTPSS